MMKKLLSLLILLTFYFTGYCQLWQPQNNFEIQMLRPVKALSLPSSDTISRMPYNNRDSVGAIIHGSDDRPYERGLSGWRGLAFTNDTYATDRTWFVTGGNTTYFRAASGTNYSSDPNVAELRIRSNVVSIKAITQNTGLSSILTMSPNGSTINGTASFTITSNDGARQSRIQNTPDSIRLAGSFINLQGKARYTSGLPGMGKVLTDTSGNGDWAWVAPVTSGGTVTSVALSVPSIFSVSGSPVTTSGTLGLSFTSGQTANQILATPDGITGALGLRSLVANDIPSLDAGKITSGTISMSRMAVSGTQSSATILRGDGILSAALAGPFTTSGMLSSVSTSGNQIQSRYDGSNTWTISTGVGGLTQINAVGAAAATKFNQRIKLGLTYVGTSADSLLVKSSSDSTVKSLHPNQLSLNISVLTAGTLGVTRGGTGLSSLGTPNQQLRVNSAGTSLEYFTTTETYGTVYGDGTMSVFPTGVSDIILTPSANNTIDLATSASYPGAAGRVVRIYNASNYTFQIHGVTTSNKFVYVVWTATNTPSFINL